MWPEEHEVGTKHMRIGEDLRLLRHFVPRNDKGGSLAMTLPNSVIASAAKQSPGWPLLTGGKKRK